MEVGAVIRCPVVLVFVICLFPASVRAQASPADPVATRKYSVALGFQKKKLYEQAATRWQQFLTAYPKNGRVGMAKHHLGVCQIRLNQFPTAAATFRDLLSKHPKFKARDSAHFNLGLALYNVALASKKQPDYQSAAKAFQ